MFVFIICKVIAFVIARVLIFGNNWFKMKVCCNRQEKEIYMQVTSVTVRKIEKEGSRMRGRASILLDDSFAVHDIRIIEGDNGLFIAMPSRKTATGGYRDIAHPINPDARKQLEDAIIAEYKKAE